MRIAFLGLGNMGGPMTRNLVAAGHEVVGYDPVEAARRTAEAAGVSISGSGEEAVRGAEVVFTMFPSGAHVLAAYRGEGGAEGLLAAAAPGTLFIDSSTISVDEAREAAGLARDAGHRALDTPVSGGVAGAAAGTLTFMVGGPAEEYEAALPLLEVMGRKIVHCGESGAGQATKACNNMLLAVTMIGASEAFVLGEKLGLSDEVLYEVMSSSAAQCWAVTTNCPVPGPVGTSPANHDYAPGFATALMAKDLGLALAALEATGTRAEFGRAAQRLYEEFKESGHGGLDFSAIIQRIREENA
ncbi:3-hydroxyisobutyrate dehydrogenase [Rothia sp. AR01]|uniref:Probable 3-hydroxyisobutyrate dehydrogenase n=1 Tax=Rothia santali TaxID=2949643 RepID=A0A9X2HEP0_9MICC|nr:3-hydroxyisobutyrate dehydrogenase [Rothia santali]MCP3426710.1 3-hydroxyisobutyrate dehydrogenase [Rothia santali]